MTLAVVTGLALHFGVSGWTSTSVAAGIDATGRSSLVLFSMAFVASSVQRLLLSFLSQCVLQKGAGSADVAPLGHEVVDDPLRCTNLDAERPAFVRTMGAQLFRGCPAWVC